MMAAKKGNVGIVRKLVQHGAKVNITNKVNPASIQIVCLGVERKTANSNWLMIRLFHIMLALFWA